MALTKNISPDSEINLLDGQPGKFASFTNVVMANLQSTPFGTNRDPTISSRLTLSSLLSDLELINNHRLLDLKYTISKAGDAHVIALKDFSTNNMKFKVISRTATEAFTKTVKNYPGIDNQIACNGSFYGFINGGSYAEAYLGPLSISKIQTTGKVFKNGSQLTSISSKASPKGFHIEFDSNEEFSFGQGDPDAGNGIGGLTPILLYNSDYDKVWKYGIGNEYENLPVGAEAPKSGDPEDFGKYLVQRNNNQYKAQNNYKLGKNILAYHPNQDIVFVIIQDDYSWSSKGQSLNFYRNWLHKSGFHYAVGFDGSNSVLLFEYSTNKLIVEPASHKYNSMAVGYILAS